MESSGSISSSKFGCALINSTAFLAINMVYSMASLYASVPFAAKLNQNGKPRVRLVK